MTSRVPPTGEGSQSASADTCQPVRSASARDLELWRQAVKDARWTTDALAAHWGLDRGYVWRILNGEKPLSRDRTLAFPDDITAAYLTLKAKAHGMTVVAPVSIDEALPMLLGGIVSFASLLRTRLPEKSSGQLKASLYRGVERRRA